MMVEYGTSRVTVEYGTSFILIPANSAPDGDKLEEQLEVDSEEIVPGKDELNKDEFGEAMVAGGLAFGAWNELNECRSDEAVVAGLVSVIENELESAVAVVMIE